MTKKNETFATWDLPRRDTPQLLVSRYRVYSDARNYVMVEAENAMEALKLSGQKQAQRIERDILFFNNVLNPGTFDAEQVEEVPQAVVPQPVIEEPVPLVTAASEPALLPVDEPLAPVVASDVPLSDEEVNKLLLG